MPINILRIFQIMKQMDSLYTTSLTNAYAVYLQMIHNSSVMVKVKCDSSGKVKVKSNS